MDLLWMKHLSYLHIVTKYDRSNYGQLEILRDKANEFIRSEFELNFVVLDGTE